VAPPDTIAALQAEADVIVCLNAPEFFHAVGQFYANFTQTTDEEVIELLEAARLRSQTSRAPSGAGRPHEP
jgi:putative phosphoribosyl transferase